MTDHYAREMYRERRRRSFQSQLRNYRNTLNGNVADIREVKEDYERVTLIYIRHLERLNAKAGKILALQKANADSLNRYVAAHQDVIAERA